jgi:hypothetical protein
LHTFNANQARITSNGLLVEESRTNAILWSQNQGITGWTGVNSSVGPTPIGSPDGGNQGWGVFDNTTNGVHNLFPSTNPAMTPGNTYTSSFYVKAGIQQNPQLSFQNSANTSNFFATASLTGAGSISATGVGGANGGTFYAASCTAAGPTGAGWYLLQVTGALATGSAYSPTIAANAGTSYSGTGLQPCFYVWQAQGEQGFWATSPIVTSGVAATRSADVITIPGVPLVTALYVSGVPLAPVNDATNQRLLEANDNTNNNRLALFRQANTGKASLVDIAGAIQYYGAVGNLLLPSAVLMKLSFSCVVGAQFGTYNGTGGAGTGFLTGTTGTVPVTTQINIGTGNNQFFNGYIWRTAWWASTGTVPTQVQQLAMTSGSNP